jgi:inner membrane protein
MDTIEKAVKRFSDSTGVKLAVIAILTLLLLIPSFMIMDLIREREQRRDETMTEVTDIWGHQQTVSAPVITIPYEVFRSDGNPTNKYLHVLPSDIRVEGEIIPEIRSRGIYKVIIYTARLHFEGSFESPDMFELNSAGEALKGKAMWLEIGIPDMRGINREINVVWNGKSYTGVPGLMTDDIAQSGIHAVLPVEFTGNDGFSFDIDINGSRALNFIPLGKSTKIGLHSSWDSPSFTGAFLPDERDVTGEGFTATWNVLHLNRNYPQIWTDEQYKVDDSAFGVEMITPVDNYQKSMRSAKYAIMFIALTFLVFLFAEIMNKTRIHAIHYLLAGLALCVFYSLLTALSEHIAFNFAFIISSSVIITMITLYTYGIFGKSNVTLVVLFSLIVLYTFLFVILQLTDYALLFGNIGLVIVLGILMYFARKINWYS